MNDGVSYLHTITRRKGDTLKDLLLWLLGEGLIIKNETQFNNIYILLSHASCSVLEIDWIKMTKYH